MPPPPWGNEEEKRTLSSRSVYESSSTSRIVNSHSAPSQGLNALASAPRLPRAQNPTITLLQKARGQRFSRKSLNLFSSKEKLRREGTWTKILINWRNTIPSFFGRNIKSIVASLQFYYRGTIAKRRGLLGGERVRQQPSFEQRKTVNFARRNK